MRVERGEDENKQLQHSSRTVGEHSDKVEYNRDYE